MAITIQRLTTIVNNRKGGESIWWNTMDWNLISQSWLSLLNTLGSRSSPFERSTRAFILLYIYFCSELHRLYSVLKLLSEICVRDICHSNVINAGMHTRYAVKMTKAFWKLNLRWNLESILDLTMGNFHPFKFWFSRAIAFAHGVFSFETISGTTEGSFAPFSGWRWIVILKFYRSLSKGRARSLRQASVLYPHIEGAF